MIRDAVISPCATYRYQLMREFEPHETVCLADTALFVLNNPSKASALTDDPTSRRGKGFASSWGYRRYYFGNCNPWRSTDPALAQMPPEDVLLRNDDFLREMAWESEIVIAAWGGKANPMLAARALRVLRQVSDVHYLALTNDGVPKHILYLKGDLRPTLWCPQYPGDRQSNEAMEVA